MSVKEADTIGDDPDYHRLTAPADRGMHVLVSGKVSGMPRIVCHYVPPGETLVLHKESVRIQTRVDGDENFSPVT